MEADDGQAPARSQNGQNCREGASEFLELLVDVNPYSLKAACGRMLAFFASADGVGDELGEFERGAQRPGFAASNNRLCNLESKPFFAIMSYDLLYFFQAGFRQPLRCGNTAARIHTHVEWAFPHEGKTADRVVDLRRGNAQVQQHAVDMFDSKVIQVHRHIAETAVHYSHARVALTESARNLDCLWVFVEHHEGGIGAQATQQQPAVAAPTECPVDIDAVERRGNRCGLLRPRATFAERSLQQCVHGGLQQPGTVHEFHKTAQKEN